MSNLLREKYFEKELNYKTFVILLIVSYALLLSLGFIGKLTMPLLGSGIEFYYKVANKPLDFIIYDWALKVYAMVLNLAFIIFKYHIIRSRINYLRMNKKLALLAIFPFSLGFDFYLLAKKDTERRLHE